MNTETAAAVTPAATVTGHCPECGAAVLSGGRGRGRVFCRPACRASFYARSKEQGQPLLPLFLAWMENRHAKPGTPEASLMRAARKECTAMARQFLDEGRKAGRPPAADYVATLLRDGERYMDRTQRPQ